MSYWKSSLRPGALVLLVVLLVGNGAWPAAAQGNSGKWGYFKFKPGQSFKYDMTSERGLKGWLSIKIEDGGNGILNVTLAGKWTEDFSETAKLKPGMSAFDFVYAFKNAAISNAANALLNIDAVFVDNAKWTDGFHWTQGDIAIDVKGEKECAGVKGWLAAYTFKVFGKLQKRTFGVNPNLPLPIYAQVPAANDTWTYSLTEKSGS